MPHTGFHLVSAPRNALGYVHIPRYQCSLLVFGDWQFALVVFGGRYMAKWETTAVGARVVQVGRASCRYQLVPSTEVETSAPGACGQDSSRMLPNRARVVSFPAAKPPRTAGRSRNSHSLLAENPVGTPFGNPTLHAPHPSTDMKEESYRQCEQCSSWHVNDP